MQALPGQAASLPPPGYIMYQTTPQLQQVTPGFVWENPPLRPPAYKFQQTMPSIPMMPTNQLQYIYVPNPQITPSLVQQLMHQQNVSQHDVSESCPSQTQTFVPKSTPSPKSIVHSIDSESDSKKTNEKDAPSSSLVKPLNDSADQYIYLQI